MIENVTKAFEEKKYTLGVFWNCQRVLTGLIITSYFTNYITVKLGDYPINGLKVI